VTTQTNAGINEHYINN